MAAADIVIGDQDDVPSPMRETGIAMVALVVAALLAYGWRLGLHVDNLHNGLLGGSLSAVGLYVVRMRPRNREGWLFVASGVTHVVMFFGRQYGLHDPLLSGAAWIGWLGVWPLPLAIALVGWTLMAFPDGRLMGRGWRTATAVMLGTAAALSVAFAGWPFEYDRVGLAAPHPLDLPGRAAMEPVIEPLTVASYLGFQVLWTAALVVRIRRVRGDEARQLRWLVSAVVTSLAVLVGGLLATGSELPGKLAIPLVPIAAGLAILKYRLYGIDPVINKTIVVGAMFMVISAGYVAIVVVGGALVPAPEGVLTLLTTAVVAVAFDPIRRRAQRLADRLVYGHRATPYEALSRLAVQLREAPDDLLDGIAATVANAVGATEVTVWAGGRDLLIPAASWPVDAPGQEATTLDGLTGPRRHVRAVIHDQSVLGAITLVKPSGEPMTGSEDRLLGDLVAQAGLVIAHQRQSLELRAAARRIVAAEDAARRRIERDLHDGAQQRLVTLGLDLAGMAEHAKLSGDAALAGRVDQARAQLLEATAELRELARGLHPMVLAEEGLGAALSTVADRSTTPVRLHVQLDERPRADVEATAYFLVSEALTNAARHADARVVRVEVVQVRGDLRVTVDDDGRGGARVGEGSGLQGLADRLAALGGRLDVDSPPGGGTTVTGVLPCA